MRSGLLDRSVVLQSYAPPSGGDPTAGTWTTTATVWAERLDPRGVERSAGVKSEAGVASQGYRIRYRSDVDPTWRLTDGSEVWRITAVLPGQGRNRESVLLVERHDPDDVT